MKKLLLILSLIPVLASAQTTRRTVTTDGDGTLVAPANLWTANAAEISAVLSLSATQITSGQLPPARLPTLTLSGFVAGTATGSGNITTTEGGQFAVFWIPLHPGDQWTDFELKASTDNFLSDNPNMVYYYHSPDPTKSVIPQQIWTTRPDVYFTDSGKTGTPNRRAWRKQNATQSVFAMLSDANAEVGGFIVIVRDNLSAHRTTMVWSYALMDGSAFDNDASGRDVWRPIVPIRWTNDLNPTIN